jgi:hypothetical protein
MKNADQLRNVSAQAYDNFKAVVKNIASINGVIAQLSQAANTQAELGLFTASANLSGVDVASGNPSLFQAVLEDTLTDMGFTVEYSLNPNTTTVIINWDIQDEDC